jgi:chorismate lyase/3-hydroxybenzoate synthase
VRVGLEPLRGAGLVELWLGTGAVERGQVGPIRYACDDVHLFGVLEIDERDHGGIGPAAEAAYAAIRRFQAGARHPHVLRMWNYFDAINAGDGDAERYKQFCVGRAAALAAGAGASARFPAATAIGRRDGDPTLQVYWLAGRHAGHPLENPRQVAAYRYPRAYGPSAPTFSRAMLVQGPRQAGVGRDARDDAGATGPLLLVSGTASVVGHASCHPDDVVAQLGETLANVDSVLEHAARLAGDLPAQLGAASVVKAYVRHPTAAAAIDARLRERLGAEPYVILAGDICRADLLVEVDVTQRAV